MAQFKIENNLPLIIGGVVVIAVGAAVALKVPPFEKGGTLDKGFEFIKARLEGRSTPTTDEEILRQMEEQGIGVPMAPGLLPPELANEAPWFNTNTGQPLVREDPNVRQTFLREVWKQIYFPPEQYPGMYNFPDDTRLRSLTDPTYNPTGQFPQGSLFQTGALKRIQGGDIPAGAIDPYVFDQVCLLYQICPPGGSTHPNDDFFYDPYEYDPTGMPGGSSGSGGSSGHIRDHLDDCYNCPTGKRWDTCLCTCVDNDAITPQCFTTNCGSCPAAPGTNRCLKIGNTTICYNEADVDPYDCVYEYGGKCYDECANPTSSGCSQCIKTCGARGF